MRNIRLVSAIAVSLAFRASTLIAQSVTADRVAAMRPVESGRVLLPSRVLVADSSRAHIPVWPFAVIGAAAGGVIAMRHYAHDVRATHDGDFAAAFTIPLTLGIGVTVGAVGGVVVGEVVRNAAR